jgi:tRNA modification GTPase
MQKTGTKKHPTYPAVTDTIIALATPVGESALAVIRISGQISSTIAKQACNCINPNPRNAYLVNYRSSDGEILDQVVITFFNKGNSYTGEDSLEISCHGNPLITEMICKDLINRGCRMAQPGEFTRQAFLNGKIDLPQAESVAQIIAAKNEQSLALAQRNLKGKLSDKLLSIQQNILNLQASIEAHIDFPEDDLDESDQERVHQNVTKIVKELETLLLQANRTKLLTKNIKVVLTGLPNVGKSSLFNALAGKNRALIHSESGTTRDYLEFDIKIGKYWITLVDTAGVHDAAEEIELAGIEMSLEQAKEADLFLWVIDNSVPHPIELPGEYTKLIRSKPTLLIRNKSDLGENNWVPDYNPPPKATNISSIGKCGLKQLEELLLEIIRNMTGEGSENEYLVGVRHEVLIKNCLDELTRVLIESKNEVGDEIVSIHLTEARKKLDIMIGRKTNEDMLDILFGEFCIGK